MTAALALKRVIDLAAGTAAMVILLPIIAVLAFLTLAAHGSPVFFRQERVGRGGRPFTLVKFRSMTDGRDAAGRLLPDEARLTRTGRIMRRFRLDELPSFWLVMTGDMSMVGPRPLPPDVIATMPGSMERHKLSPGFTGLAQVSGNTLLSNREKLALDLLYVRNWSLAKDARIILKTFATVLLGERRDEPLIQTALQNEGRTNPGLGEGARP